MNAFEYKYIIMYDNISIKKMYNTKSIFHFKKNTMLNFLCDVN
jgi:hypothetical protein